MNKNFLVSLMLFTGIITQAPSSAYAFTEGQLDNVWFKTRIKTTLKKAHGVVYLADTPVSLSTSQIKFDSGNDKCYSGFHFEGSSQYTLHTVCKILGAWERDDSTGFLYELNDGNVASDWSYLYLPAENKTEYPFSEDAAYVGTLVFKKTLKADGSVKNVRLIQPQDGTIYYENNVTNTWGTARSGLSMLQVDPSKVPAGAQACFDSIFDPAHPIPNCAAPSP